MARVLGVIAEYNPFHNGHKFHLQESIKKAETDYTVAVISGNFVQRGNPSVVNKWQKAKMALESGVDLVIELPTIYSVSSAENFAYGAIQIFNNLKIVNTVSFGTETDDLAGLNNIANLLIEEPKEYGILLQEELKKGNSFPKARQIAVLKILNDDMRYLKLLTSPNNILGIEYLKSLKRSKSTISPMIVKRENVYYNDEAVVDDFASATAIRRLIALRQYEDLRKVMPKKNYFLLMDEVQRGNYVLDLCQYEKEIIYNLRRMSLQDIANLPDVSEGLENSIKNAASLCNHLSELINMVKTKRYTGTRVQRILIYCLLGITKKDMALSKKAKPYVRVVGMNEKGKALISKIKKANPKLEIITSVKKFMDYNKDKVTRQLLDIDIRATDIYTLGYQTTSLANMDYTNCIVIKE